MRGYQIRDYYERVKRILMDYPETRDDDMRLYTVYCAQFGLVKPNEGFYVVMYDAKKRGMPSYESISRARRKVQENEPSLSGKRRNLRKKEEEKYRDYYRNH